MAGDLQLRNCVIIIELDPTRRHITSATCSYQQGEQNDEGTARSLFAVVHAVEVEARSVISEFRFFIFQLQFELIRSDVDQLN